MNKIDINESNVEVYQEYLDIKNNVYTGKGSVLWTLLAMSLVVIPPLCAIPYTILFHQILLALSVTPSMLTTIIAIGIYFAQDITITALWGEKIVDVVLSKMPKRIRMKKFLKKHPDFDITLSEEDVQKLVKEYSENSKLCEKIKTEKTSKNVYDNNIYKKPEYINYNEFQEKEKPKIKSKIYPR